MRRAALLTLLLISHGVDSYAGTIRTSTPRPHTSPHPAKPAFSMPKLPTHMALPVLSYSTLAGVTAGTLKLLQPLAWQGVALTGFSVGFPMAMILAQLALSGGSGVAKSMGGFQTDDEHLKRLAHEAATAVGVPAPSVFEIKSREPNAFAASGAGGRDASVTVTTGLREILNDNELGAVLAHEMGHLRHRDVLRNMHVAAAAAGLGGIYDIGRVLLDSERRSTSRKRKKSDDSGGGATLGLGLMAAGLTTNAMAHLFRLMASRSAEIKADRAAAEAYGADAIISALQKIDQQAARRPADLRSRSDARAFTHAMISDGPSSAAVGAKQVGGRRGLLGALGKMGDALRTHPTLEKRVAALEQAAADGVVPARRSASSWFR